MGTWSPSLLLYGHTDTSAGKLHGTSHIPPSCPKAPDGRDGEGPQNADLIGKGCELLTSWEHEKGRLGVKMGACHPPNSEVGSPS